MHGTEKIGKRCFYTYYKHHIPLPKYSKFVTCIYMQTHSPVNKALTIPMSFCLRNCEECYKAANYKRGLWALNDWWPLIIHSSSLINFQFRQHKLNPSRFKAFKPVAFNPKSCYTPCSSGVLMGWCCRSCIMLIWRALVLCDKFCSESRLLWAL